MKFVQIKGRSQMVSQDKRTNAAADVRFMPCACILGIEHTMAFVHFLILTQSGTSLLHGVKLIMKTTITVAVNELSNQPFKEQK
jgi:hypothetical protein